MWAKPFLLAAVLFFAMAAEATLTPARLRCEYLANPVGIDEAVPRLSWIVESNARNARQSAYQILVASEPALLKPGKANLWDSGRVTSDETAHIEYGGKPLASRQRAWWTVASWDESGKRSGWAKPAFWERGLAQADWQASWIGAPEPNRPKIDTAGAKWIWFAEGDPVKEAPAGDRFFRLLLHLRAKPAAATIAVAVDNQFVLFVNGKEVGNGANWRAFTQLDIGPFLKAGDNEIRIRGINHGGPAGMLAAGNFTFADGGLTAFKTGSGGWEASIDGKQWSAPRVLGDLGMQPWGESRFAEPSGPSPHLRRQFSLAKRVKRARAYVTAKGLYKLYVDGKQVGDGVFTPGWTDYNKRIQYQTYDVTKLLQPGPHAVGLVLGDGWYCGHVGWSGRQQYGPRAMGLCQIELEYEDGSRDLIVSDSRWRAGTGAILSSDLLMGEDYDARLHDPAWTTMGFRDQSWGTPSIEPLGDVPLVGQHSETVEKLAELKPKAVTQPKPGVYVFDLGQNLVGWARLRVKGKAGQKVTMRFAEMLNPDGTVYLANMRSARATDTCTLSGKGTETYEPSFTFHGFRYVEVTGFFEVPGEEAITGIVAGSATPPTGTFECSNGMVNQLWHNIFWGQRGNYLEVPTDCPQRDERLGWMGDAQVFVRTATYNNDIGAFMTKWVQDIRDAQSKEGGFTDVTPRIVDMADGAPAWGDAGVIVPWTIYLAYGDRRMLERHFGAMKAWVDYIDTANPNHLWMRRRNNDFGDWLSIKADTPKEVIATAYFAYSTDLVARAAKVLGRSSDAAKYGTLLKEIKKAFNEAFVSEDGTVKGQTQTVYTLALRFDLVPASMRPLVTRKLVEDLAAKGDHLSTGFVGVSYLNPTLSSVGRNNLAFKLLMNDTFPSWGYSIRQGATTIWERWDGWTEDKGFQDPGMNSFNHYALGSVGEWLYSTVAGIDLDPAEPGFKHIRIRPQLGGGLTWARGSYESIRGRIATDWRIANGQLTLKVTIPANTRATVSVPTSDPQSVRLDGRPAPGATHEIGSGTYEFTARA